MALVSSHPTCGHYLDGGGWCMEPPDGWPTTRQGHCAAHEPLYHISKDDVYTALVSTLEFWGQSVAVNQIWYTLRKDAGKTGIEKHQVAYRLQQLKRDGRAISVFRKGQQGASIFWHLTPSTRW